ncbi:MAG: hypothetical protein P4L73_11175 [Caulobacteraceae bacterium]|nr:hypothetical protein [Caulobacteraceae bacterium]
MAESDLGRAADAERMRGYFAVQLLLAARVAELRGLPLGDAALSVTNLHRRFGLGRPEQGAAPAWADYAERLQGLASAEQRLDWTVGFFAARPPEAPPEGHVRFGCFSFEPPDADGAVRIHFNNRDSADGIGPLASAKRPARLAELSDMFACLRRDYPSARTVNGGSWLYNLDAYQRLFPPEYAASRSRPERLRLTGTSSWGQFLDHRGEVKAPVRQAFIDNLDGLDPLAPWRAFPLHALTARAPVERFYDFYGRERS